MPEKRLKNINSAHSFRHYCAVHMLSSGSSQSEIRTHLGHEDIQSTSVYLHLDLSRKKQLIEHMQSSLELDSNLKEMIDRDLKEDTLALSKNL